MRKLTKRRISTDLIFFITLSRGIFVVKVSYFVVWNIIGEMPYYFVLVFVRYSEKKNSRSNPHFNEFAVSLVCIM